MKLLKIHTLGKGWCDRDHILLHAAFQVFINFMEQEKPGKTIDWSYDAIHRKAWKDMQELYHWWTKERPNRKSPLDDKKLVFPPMEFKKVPGSNLSTLVRPKKKKYSAYYKASRIYRKLQIKWHKEDTKNLHRLINIRDFLWT